MVEAMCANILPDGEACMAPAIPCLRCSKVLCQRCLEAHNKQDHHFPVPVVISTQEPEKLPDPATSEPLTEDPAHIEEVENLKRSMASSPFDPLFVNKPPSEEPINLPPEEPEKPEESLSEEQVGEMFSAEIGRVVSALDLLARRGLNQAAVVALIHDADSKIPKSTILKVLKTLRQLPDLYGRKRPGRKI